MIKKIIVIFLLGFVTIAFSSFHLYHAVRNTLFFFVSLSFFSLIAGNYLQLISVKLFLKLIFFSLFFFIIKILSSVNYPTKENVFFILYGGFTIITMFTIGNYINIRKKRTIYLIVIIIAFISFQFLFTERIVYAYNIINEQQIKKLPKFELLDLDGNVITQDDFKGKVVFFDFWSVTCGQCIAQFPSIENARNKFKDNSDVKFYLINYNGPRDNIEYVKKFTEKRELQIPVLFDLNSKLAKDLECFAFPHSFIVDKNMNIRYHHKGYQKSLEDLYIKEVTNYINELLNE